MKKNFNPSYIGPRNDILKLIPNGINKVLDVGCSTGALGESIKRENNAEVTGIEVDKDMADVANEKFNRVVVEDIEKINLSDYFSSEYFDCIIFADVLEHLTNPWKLLTSSVNLLRTNGIIIASIPNIRHYSTIFNLLFSGIWPYKERGIHDRMHLRFFTLRNIKEMFQGAGLEIIRIERKYRIIEKPHRFNRFSKYFAYLFLRDFLTFQFLIVGKKHSAKKP
ncbi:MAG: methyltransferase domain-containing protein [Sedimentisphaerales bacterium]|nr:methyltransferase domain-containing protein [Sedimentisphaerales bacterium]